MAKKDRSSVFCRRTRQFKDLYSCALNCRNRCDGYRERVTLALLQEFVDKHPDYAMIGELMATKVEASKEKQYWVLTEDNQVKEVPESEIMNNPREYLGKQIWDKPPFKYELVISLKRVKD